jgi:hypothetical protein
MVRPGLNKCNIIYLKRALNRHNKLKYKNITTKSVQLISPLKPCILMEEAYAALIVIYGLVGALLDHNTGPHTEVTKTKRKIGFECYRKGKVQIGK